MPSKKTSNETTSAKVASTAAKQLSNSKSTASVKRVAGSALTQHVKTKSK